MPDNVRINESYFGAPSSSHPSSQRLDTPRRRDRTADRKGAVVLSSEVPGLTDYKAMLDTLASARGNLDSRYRFDAAKYDEKQSQANITRFANDLTRAGMPKWVAQQGLAHAEKNLGQKGVRDWRHWHHQKAVDNAVIETGIDRMRALLAPGAGAQKGVGRLEAELADLRGALEETKGKLVEPKARLAALADSQTRYGAQVCKELSEEVRGLEEDAAVYAQLIAASERALATLRKVVSSAAFDPDPKTHLDRVQSHLVVMGSDQAFQAAYDRTNPGDLSKGIGGGLRRMQLWRSTKEYLKSLTTLSISS